MEKKRIDIKQGDIVWADIPFTSGSIQFGKRPCVIISNNACNRFSPVMTAVTCTLKKKNDIPTHIRSYFLGKWQTVLCEQIIPLEKEMLIGPPYGNVGPETVKHILDVVKDVQLKYEEEGEENHENNR